MKLIDKDALVAEIERRKQKLLDHIICERDKEFACRTAHQLNRIIDFIDTIEVKEVDLDFEKELYKAFGQVKDFTLGMRIAKWFYDMGKNNQEPVSEKKCMFTKDSYTDEDRKVLCEDCKERCEYSKEKELISDDLEEAAKSYSNNLDNICGSIGKQTRNAFKAGAKWQKEHLWKSADGNDLPEIDREVIALLDNGKVVFAHRPPEFWDGKDIITGKVTRNYPKTYDKGGWNIPDVKYWLDVKLPKEIEL